MVDAGLPTCLGLGLGSGSGLGLGLGGGATDLLEP